MNRIARRRRGLAGRVATVAAAVGAALPLAGCGLLSSGLTVTSPVEMTVTSAEFEHGDILPVRFTCANGQLLTPPLEWAGAPPHTKSIAIVFDDADAPITPYVYWIVFDIKPATSDILEGQLPPGARQAQNSAGRAGYDPPCPGPQGHWYRFTVYALDTVLNLPENASLESTWMAIAAATIGRGRMTAFATS